jgi:hypothetical protein
MMVDGQVLPSVKVHENSEIIQAPPVTLNTNIMIGYYICPLDTLTLLLLLDMQSTLRELVLESIFYITILRSL